MSTSASNTSYKTSTKTDKTRADFSEEHHHSNGITSALWDHVKRSKDSHFGPLTSDHQSDVCVIGGGIAGLTTAYLLAKKGVSVCVLEQRNLLYGETQRTSAHLMSECDDRYFDVERIHGEAGARMFAHSHATAIDTIERIVNDESIDAEFERLDGYLFLSREHGIDLLEKERDAAHRAGLTGVQLLPNYDRFGPVLRFPNQGQFHPTKYLNGVASAIAKHGGTLYTDTRVTEIGDEVKGQPIRVGTRTGYSVYADKVVIATNAPIKDNALVYGKQAPYRSFVIGLKLSKQRGDVKAAPLPRALFWDTKDDYHYVRYARDGHDDVLVVGGEDVKTAHADDQPARFDALERWANERLGISGERAYAWSGQVMETVDDVAMIGLLPLHERTYIATGDSGMGMTHGTIAGIILSTVTAPNGGEHEWLQLYAPTRFKVQASGELLQENADVAKEMAKGYLGPAEVSSTDEVKPGCGALMRNGVSKAAVYRDNDGRVHTFSAVCPHKGGIVQFNSGEQSFDCPLHGSRFDAVTGRAICGPTMLDLEDIAEKLNIE